jgi:hypothetical protein
MKRKITLFLWLSIPIFCVAQNPLPRYYEYDAAGNRIVRKVIEVSQAPPAPPEDSVASTSSATDLLQVTSDELQVTRDVYFVEKVAHVEMKIYPNPATEKITFEISCLVVGGENLRPLQLFSLNGQLLQTQPVTSPTTTISLAGLAKGTYILKVQVNEHTEYCKIIKQ